jgi:hypothetical protein
MKTTEIRARGEAMGLKLPPKMRKGEMIRSIQRAEGYAACFGADDRFACPQLECCWRSDCLTVAPG